MVSLVAPGTAHAANSVSFFKGLSATALFSSTDPIGCTTDALVFATQSKSYGSTGKDSASAAFVTIARSGNCADMLGTFDGSATPLPSRAFKVASDLTSATLNTSVNVCNVDTLACFDVAVALTWNGVGDLTSQEYHDQVVMGRCTIDTKSVGRERLAVASGGVVNATTNFTPAQSTDAVLDLATIGLFQKHCA
jgi:hypothetical protein